MRFADINPDKDQWIEKLSNEQRPNGPWKRGRDEEQVVVNRTFINVVDTSLATEGLRRIRSDSVLYKPDKEEAWSCRSLEENESGSAAFDISDSEAGTHTERTHDREAGCLPCYAHVRDDSPSETSSVSHLTVTPEQSEEAGARTEDAECHSLELQVGSSSEGEEQDLKIRELVALNVRLVGENTTLKEQRVLIPEHQPTCADLRPESFEPECQYPAVQMCLFGDVQWQPCWFPTAIGGAFLPLPAESAPMGVHSTDRRNAGRRTYKKRAHKERYIEASLADNALCRSEETVGSTDIRTTVMLRNLPNNYSRAMLLKMLDHQGFRGLYDFVYLPMDFKSSAALGYAFINLLEPSLVPNFWAAFDGFRTWAIPSKKTCYVSWCLPHQGVQAHIEQYQNSPVMHSSVPDTFKPVLFNRAGARLPFPFPTKAIRPPRFR